MPARPRVRASSSRARAISAKDLTVYVENAGDFFIPASAVVSVQSEKVTFNCDKLDGKLRDAIGNLEIKVEGDLRRERSRFRAANAVLHLSDLRRVVAPGASSSSSR